MALCMIFDWMKPLADIYLFRITHIDNLAFDLAHGLWAQNTQYCNPDFVPIGDHRIITHRNDMAVRTRENGRLADYVPFYFCARSPMLHMIQHGPKALRRPPSELIYYVLPLKTALEGGGRWCFTDGNARVHTSQYYETKEDLARLDWQVIGSQNWIGFDFDQDRKRRKQAEFLIKGHVPFYWIQYLITYDAASSVKARGIVEKSGVEVLVKPSGKHYF
jgi:hypothetical protein